MWKRFSRFLYSFHASAGCSRSCEAGLPDREPCQIHGPRGGGIQRQKVPKLKGHCWCPYKIMIHHEQKGPYDANYMWQQDAAPCHMVKKTQEYLKENMSNFWGKDLSPPKSPDLNFLECCFLAYMEQMACKKLHPSVDALRATISSTWKKMNDVYVMNTCQSFRHGLESMIAKNGGIF